MTNDINIYEPIYVQYGTQKQTLYPYETLADISYVTNLGVCADDCVRIDLSECSDDCVQVGLTVERLKRKLKFGIPRSATATRNGLPLGDDAQVLPGNVIEFVRPRDLGARRRVKRSKNTTATEHCGSDNNEEPAEPVQDFVFAFDAVRRQWHVRFRYGETAEEVEQDWLQDSPSIRYIPYLLERPTDQILCTTIFPPLPAEPVSRSANADARVESFEDQQSDHEFKMAAWKAAKHTRDEWRQTMAKFAAEIKEAREANDEESAVELEATFALLEQQYNREFDIHGRVRTGVSNADQSAANRIRNGIGRVLKKCIDGSPRKKYALNRFAEYLEKKLDYNGGYARYVDNKRWHVVYPPDGR